MNHPYVDLESRGYWRTGVAEAGALGLSDLYRPKFQISPTEKIASAGSCFAQHIGRQLRMRGFNYLDYEPAPPAMPFSLANEHGYSMFSARYGNVYSSRQLKQLLERALGRFNPSEDFWTKDGRSYDAFRPTIEPQGFGSLEEMRHLRTSHLHAVRRLFSNVDVFVFTLGLTETWLSLEDGSAFPVCPGVAAGEFDPAKYEFHNLTYPEIVDDMKRFIATARRANPSLRIVLTVSPVPLTATATGEHVLSASTYSKSTLRAVAGDLSAQFDFVDYFPSYEIITSVAAGGRFYESNLRNVRADAVDYVMSHFFHAHGHAETGPTSYSMRGEVNVRELVSAEDLKEIAVLCDEEKLDLVPN